MKNLLGKNNFLFILLAIIAGCTSASSFKIYNETDGKTELLVTSDRILAKCLDLEKDYKPKDRTKEGKFIFYLEILDEENTVTGVGMDNVFDRDYCYQRKMVADKIIERSNTLYIGGMFNLHKPRKIESLTHHFPKHGIFHENGRNLDFIILKGDNGKCTTAVWGDICETEIFPIKKFPF